MALENERARLTALAAVSDPADRACFDVVAASTVPMGRDEVAAALQLPRATAAFRLDKLVTIGLLSTEFQRRTGRAGPGAGRPAKLYRLAVDEVTASVPERHYDLAAQLLAGAVERAEGGTPLREALERTASERGIEIGREARSLDAALNGCGYVPEPDAGEIRLTNCPFHRLAVSHTTTICAVNHALLQGVLEGVGDDPGRAAFQPDPPGCCVRIRSAD